MKNFLLVLIAIVVCSPFLAQNNHSEIVDYLSYYKVDGKKLFRTDSVLLQINSIEGDDNSMIYIPYSKKDKISVKEAWIEDLSGNIIRKIKRREIRNRHAISGSSLYQDDYVKYFELKHNVYPYRIRYTYTATYSKYMTIYNFHPGDIPKNNVKVVIDSPINNPIVHKQRFISEPVIEKTDDMARYIWQFSYAGYENEINAWYEQSSDFPYLVVQPLHFNFKEKGNFMDWDNYGNWYYRLNKGLDVLPESEKYKIDRLLSGIKDDKRKIEILYNYLQTETRYINVSINYGGFQAYPAKYVCSNRYGDCKALSNYMKAILSYAGITSYFTLIYSNESPKTIYENFPSSNYFNHVILSIPSEKDTMFLECTAKNYPPGYIHSGIQNRKALIVKETGSHLVNIPAMQPRDVLCSSNMNIDLKSNGYSQFEFEKKNSGYDYEFYKFLSSDIDKNNIDIYVRNVLFRGINVELSKYNIKDVAIQTPQAVFSCDGKIANHCALYGKNMIINPISYTLPVYEIPENRKYGLQLNMPIFSQDAIVYTVDKSFLLKPGKDLITIKTKFGEYNFSYLVDGNKITVRKSLLIFAGNYPVEEYAGFHSFINRVKDNEMKKLYIELQ